MRGDLKVDFKTLKMMDLRSSPGEVLDRVARDGDVFLIERSGQPMACLVPVSYLLPDIHPDRIAKELNNLKDENFKLTINERRELVISLHEVAAGDDVILSIVLPHGYPNSAPRILAANVASNAPRRWRDDSLAIFGTSATWNPKSHDAMHALNLARGWLRQYAKWRKTGEWPGRTDSR